MEPNEYFVIYRHGTATLVFGTLRSKLTVAAFTIRAAADRAARLLNAADFGPSHEDMFKRREEAAEDRDED